MSSFNKKIKQVKFKKTIVGSGIISSTMKANEDEWLSEFSKNRKNPNAKPRPTPKYGMSNGRKVISYDYLADQAQMKAEAKQKRSSNARALNADHAVYEEKENDKMYDWDYAVQKDIIKRKK